MNITKFLLLFLSAIATAQSVGWSDMDRQLFAEKTTEFKNLNPQSDKIITSVGKSFIGTAYVAKTLEVNEQEQLVINLHEFDCTTYVENVLVFSMLVEREAFEQDAFANLLRNIRYRDGELDGYGSRLHYFTEWIEDNSKKGIVKNITREIGGVPIEKPINFMSSHRELYPMLKDDSNFKNILAAEEQLNQKTIYFLPQAKVREAESQLADGDIIALATSINGLDVTHTGFVYKKKNGRAHLLHASSSGEVEISNKPLDEYLKGIKNNTGIIVARPY